MLCLHIPVPGKPEGKGRRLQHGAQPGGEQVRREAGAHWDLHVPQAARLAEGKLKPREEYALIKVYWPITRAAGAKS